MWRIVVACRIANNLSLCEAAGADSWVAGDYYGQSRKILTPTAAGETKPCWYWWSKMSGNCGYCRVGCGWDDWIFEVAHSCHQQQIQPSTHEPGTLWFAKSMQPLAASTWGWEAITMCNLENTPYHQPRQAQ